MRPIRVEWRLKTVFVGGKWGQNEIQVKKTMNHSRIDAQIASKLLQFSPYSINKRTQTGVGRFRCPKRILFDPFFSSYMSPLVMECCR